MRLSDNLSGLALRISCLLYLIVLLPVLIGTYMISVLKGVPGISMYKPPPFSSLPLE